MWSDKVTQRHLDLLTTNALFGATTQEVWYASKKQWLASQFPFYMWL